MSATVLHLVTGVVFFTESLEIKHDSYILDAKATVALQATQGADGQPGLNATRMSEAAFKPTTLKVPMSAIVYTQDVTDGDFLAQMRAHLSGIILPKPAPLKPYLKLERP